jgi:hypothetical protein
MTDQVQPANPQPAPPVSLTLPAGPAMPASYQLSAQTKKKAPLLYKEVAYSWRSIEGA